MKNLAIIPARGGSKRIPRKNIKDFLGKPIIAYSIETALRSELFDEVMVSTDDEEIADVARDHGAKVPFMRSDKNSDDYTGPGDVVEEVLEDYDRVGKKFTNICCIFATAPLLKVFRLKEGFNLFAKSDFDVVFTVCEFSSPIWRSYKINNKKGIEMNFLEFETKRSQDLSNSYFDAGQFYWFEKENFIKLENKNIFGQSKGAVVLDNFEVQDIDTIDDWNMVKLKYKFLKRNNNLYK